MPAMKSYPALTLSETYIRQYVYDNLPPKIKEKMTFEEFRAQMNPKDYRYFAGSFGDHVNNAIVDTGVFDECLSRAMASMLGKNNALSDLYLKLDIQDRDNDHTLYE